MVSSATDRRVVNFMVVGDVRSGTRVVASAAGNRPGAVCHIDLFHDDESVRRAAHEDYFGQCVGSQRPPEWFVPGEVSPHQYVGRAVLDNPLRGEQAVGLRVLYPVLRRLELYDYVEERCREGDFCVVHVRRNPVACLVSRRQAEQSGVWWRGGNDYPQTSSPVAVRLDPAEVVEFCRAHMATAGKVSAACDDTLDVAYHDLFRDFQAVMRRVFDFLELPDSEEPAVASCRRLRNRTIHERVSNWEALCREVPQEVRTLLDAEDLF